MDVRPKGLGPAGRRLWSDYLKHLELDAGEAAILESACRTADELDRLEAGLRGLEPVTVGSTGQAKAHPLFAELRAHRSLLATLLRQLQPGAEAHGSTASMAARTAARARWSRYRPKVIS